MKVVILAGGFGTRMAELTHKIPKPMVEIGGYPIIGISCRFMLLTDLLIWCCFRLQRSCYKDFSWISLNMLISLRT